MADQEQEMELEKKEEGVALGKLSAGALHPKVAPWPACGSGMWS
jgi:hypothetical protein